MATGDGAALPDVDAALRAQIIQRLEQRIAQVSAERDAFIQEANRVIAAFNGRLEGLHDARSDWLPPAADQPAGGGAPPPHPDGRDGAGPGLLPLPVAGHQGPDGSSPNGEKVVY